MNIELTEKEIQLLRVLLSQGVTLQHKPGSNQARETLDIFDSINRKLQGEKP